MFRKWSIAQRYGEQEVYKPGIKTSLMTFFSSSKHHHHISSTLLYFNQLILDQLTMFPPPAAPKSLIHRHRQLAPSAAVKVSPICLGSMNFGDAWKSAMGECNKKTTFEILDYFYEKGGNFIDTANNYQFEESEQWIGEWIAARKNRDEIVLATKYSFGYKVYDQTRLQSNYLGNNKKSLRISVDASLKKLQVEYIDILYVHWWDYTTSIPELMHSLNNLVDAGKVLYLGVSDTPAWIVSKANQYARDHGLQSFSVYQGMYNAATRDLEREIFPMARDEGMAVLTYAALGQGQFQTEASFADREKANPGRKFAAPTPIERQVSKVLEGIAEKKGTKLTSIALAYVIGKNPYVFPLLGGRKVEHLRDNIEALAVTLTAEEIEEIDLAYEFDPGFPHTFLSGSQAMGTKPRGASKPEDVFFTGMMGHFDWVKSTKAIQLE